MTSKARIVTKTASERKAEKIRHILYSVCISKVPQSSTQIFKKVVPFSSYKAPRIYEIIENLSPIWDLYLFSGYNDRHRYPEPIKYLDFKPKEKTNQSALNAKKDFETAIESHKKIEREYDYGKIGKDKLELERKSLMKKEEYYFEKVRRDYRYYPNLRTLLLYLYHEYNSKSTTRKMDHIRQVLSNPMIIRIAPFLKHWKDFEECGFDVVDIFYDLLKDITIELRTQLHIKAENDTYLLKRVTERIFYEFEKYFRFMFETLSPRPFIEKNGIENYNKLIETRNRYRKSLVSIQQDWLEDKRKELNFYEAEQIEFDFKKELYNYIHDAITNDVPVVNVKEVMYQYEKSEYDTINLLLQPHSDYYSSDRPHYYEYKNRKYLITIPCLILEYKSNGLKSLLIDGVNKGTIVRYSQASSFLANNGIPSDSHSDLIRRLGFSFIRKNERGEFCSTDPIIVQKQKQKAKRT